MAGWPTTHGSAGASRAPVATSDPVVHRFVDAGFVLLGKTTTSEFGTVPFTESAALGISRNPWDPERTPGGSSSGSGAAVAAGMAPIAHAADGGGSIRIPASCNGLVGLKPTRGLVTNAKVESEGMATHGVLTRSVADTAAALDVLARHDPAAWWSPPSPTTSFADAVTVEAPTGLRIGVLTDSPIEGIRVDPACMAAVDATLQTLESSGHHVVDAPLALPSTDELLVDLHHDLERRRRRSTARRTGPRGAPQPRPARGGTRRSTRGRTRKRCGRPRSCLAASSKASSPASTSS